MLDFLRLGTEQYVHAPHGWRRAACRLIGHRGFGFAIKLWALRRQLKRLPGDLKVKRILDVGCGDGMYSFFLRSQFPDAQIDGIDGDPSAIENANRVVDSSSRFQGMRFQMVRFEQFTPETQYDLVVCLDCVYYTDRGLEFLANICRTVAPGGCLIMSCPRLKRHYRHSFDYYVGHVDVDRLDKLYQPERTAEVIQQSGLALVASDNYPSRLAQKLVEQQRARRLYTSVFYPACLGITWLARKGSSESATHYMYLATRCDAA